MFPRPEGNFQGSHPLSRELGFVDAKDLGISCLPVFEPRAGSEVVLSLRGPVCPVGLGRPSFSSFPTGHLPTGSPCLGPACPGDRVLPPEGHCQGPALSAAQGLLFPSWGLTWQGCRKWRASRSWWRAPVLALRSCETQQGLLSLSALPCPRARRRRGCQQPRKLY